MRCCLLALLAHCVLGQPAPTAPPTRQEKAAELLDAAERMAGTVSLETHVLSLMHIGDARGKLDKTAAARVLTQAFSSASGLPAERRSGMQSSIVRKLASFDATVAAELLRTMDEPGKVFEAESAATAVVNQLLASKDLDRAIAVLNLIPASAEFPFAAAQAVFEKIPEDDGRRAVVFGRAIEAWSRNATGPFTEFVEKHWKQVPRPLAQQALSAVMRVVLQDDGSTKVTETLEVNKDGKKDSVKLESRQAIEIFRLIELIRQLDPARIDEAKKVYPDLAEALQRFPGGRSSVGHQTTTTTNESKDRSSANSTSSGEGEEIFGPSLGFALTGLDFTDMATLKEKMDLAQQDAEKAEKAIQEKDVRKGLATAAEVKNGGFRAQAFAIIAGKSKDAAVLDKSLTLLKDVKEPGSRFAAWLAVADAAHELKDLKIARSALTSAVADARSLFALDTDPEKGNKDPRDVWGSIQAIRLASFTAAKVLGVEADTILATVDEPDLAVLGRIEMARQFLDLQFSVRSIQFSR